MHCSALNRSSGESGRLDAVKRNLVELSVTCTKSHFVGRQARNLHEHNGEKMPAFRNPNHNKQKLQPEFLHN